MSYTQLTFQERYLIERCHQNGESQTQIADKLNRSCSTIGRELQRNACEAGDYRADEASKKAQKRTRNGGELLK